MLNLNHKSILKIIALLFSLNLSSQSNSDLDYLELLPDSQAQSIAERLGVETGKPVNDEIKMDTFDSPKFASLEAKKEPQPDISADLIREEELKIFGRSLFKDSPTTFAPIDLAPAPMDYVMGPGDEVRVLLYGSKSINRSITVNREGNLIIPEIGVIQASGLLFSEIKSRLEDMVEASLIGTRIEISLAKIRSIQVFVLGNAETPGAFTVSSLSNISNVLFFSGGPSKNGSLRNIEVKRNGDSVGSFDLYDLLIEGDVSSDIKLSSNDALVINPIGKSISISGEVRNNARFELLEYEGFNDLLRFASGLTSKADKSKVTLSRYADNGERIYINYSTEELQDVDLEDGDDIFIHQLSNTPRNVIRIKGETTSAGLYAYEEGINLGDLIKLNSHLDTTYTPFTIIERENSQGSKYLVRANLLNSYDNEIPLKPNDTIYVLSRSDIDFLNSILVADSLGLLSEKSSQSFSNYFKNRNLQRYSCKSLQLLAKQSSSSSIKFVKSKYLPNPNLDPLEQLQFVKSCPEIFETKPYLIIFALENSSVISGEVRNPGIYPSYKISSLPDLLSFAGGFTDKSSGFVDIFSDEGISLKVNLNEEIDLVSLGVSSSFYANLSSRINKEVFSVVIEGSVVSPGIYGAKQGERLSDLVLRAGGYKSNAYPYGGILARKSDAEKEKIDYLKSADQLEESIATAISSGRISSVGVIRH